MDELTEHLLDSTEVRFLGTHLGRSRAKDRAKDRRFAAPSA